jgi:signal transduction histidine kinase
LRENPNVEALHEWVEAVVSLILIDTPDQEYATELGQQFDITDNMQPSDCLLFFDTFHHALVEGLPNELLLAIYPTLLTTLNAVIGGFYIGKARRAAALNLSAISKMGHDIKTPINAITGFSHVILKEIDGPITLFQKEDLTSIHEAGKKLLAMMNDLTGVMKYDAGRIGIYPSKFSVSDLISEIIANIYPQCASAGHKLNIQLIGHIGSIEGDVSKIRWIFLSLLFFLIRQIEAGQISLTVERKKIEDRFLVECYIQSNALDRQNVVTGKVVQVSSTEMINRDIGLATCWRFCTSIGASLVMYEGKGTTFKLQIPLKTIPNENY